MKNVFYDTETCGFHGPIVLLQYAIDNEEIKLYEVWKEPVQKTLDLIEELLKYSMVGFNLAFDHFHLCQQYTTLSLINNKNKPPEIEEYAALEQGAFNGPCLKPVSCLDLMLHARKGPYQSTMDRNDIRLKRIPAILAEPLADYLTKKIKLPDVYFARQVDPKKRWAIYDVDGFDDLKDVVLKFKPSSALKALAEDALGVHQAVRFKEVDIPKEYRPREYGYAPFAGKNTGNWPEVVKHHIDHWANNHAAREYARLDVEYTRKLYEYFGRPEPDDDDSVLACMVGACRWKGYNIDIKGIKELKEKIKAKIEKCTINHNATKDCYNYLTEVMSSTEKLNLKNDENRITTGGKILEDIAKWELSDVCNDCFGEGCDKCNDGFVSTGEKHPAAERAKEILEARHAEKEIQIYDKLLQAGRFHASFKVIGALSSRMSGSDGLNAQGIKGSKVVRKCFPLADPNNILCGGDFDGFEVTLMDAAYNDPDLRNELLSGKKIHALFGQFLFPGNSYEDIIATDEFSGEKSLYKRSKQGVFALAYGGEASTLKKRVGIALEDAENAVNMWNNKFKTFGNERKKILDKFCSMRQPKGIGTKVEWHEPAEYIESLFKFRRYFTLENTICKVLFDLGTNLPKEWTKFEGKIIRREHKGIQTYSGAVRSALFAAAFAIQSANMRAAGNHIIQSSGATLTKSLQRKIWDLQPAGINPWRVQPFNVHDEIQCVCDSMETSNTISKLVEDFVQENRSKVPLLAISWSPNMETWGDK